MPRKNKKLVEYEDEDIDVEKIDSEDEVVDNWCANEDYEWKFYEVNGFQLPICRLPDKPGEFLVGFAFAKAISDIGYSLYVKLRKFCELVPVPGDSPYIRPGYKKGKAVNMIPLEAAKAYMNTIGKNERKRTSDDITSPSSSSSITPSSSKEHIEEDNEPQPAQKRTKTSNEDPTTKKTRDNPKGQAEKLFQEGMDLLNNGDIENARDCFRYGLGKNHENAALWGNLAATYLHEKRFKEALNPLLHAVKFDPKNKFFAVDLGEASWNIALQYKEPFRTKELVRASNIFRRLIDRHPKFGEAHYGLSVVLYHMSNFQKALDCVHSAIALGGPFPQSYSHKAAVLNGMRKEITLKARGDKKGKREDQTSTIGQMEEEVEILLQEVVEQWPDNIEGWNDLGSFYFETENKGKAAYCYKQALKLNSKDQVALFNLGRLGNVAPVAVNFMLM